MKSTGRSRKRKSGFLSSSRLILVGGAAACALAIVLIMNFGIMTNPSQDFTPSSGLPTASSTDASATPSPTEIGPEGNSTASPDPDPAESGATSGEGSVNHQSPQVHFTDDNFALLRSDPDKFANSTVAISGRIHEIVDQSSGSQILITYRIHNQAIDSDESRAAVMYQQTMRSGTSMPDIILDECIAIQGKVRGGIGDTNSLGSPIRIPIIDSQSVAEIECVDSAMPAIKTIDANLVQSYAGIELRAERVQFSDGHLRVKISALNAEGGDSVFIREKETRAEYQGKLYQNLNHLFLFSSYALDPTLPAESQVSGYLFFEPIQDYTGGEITFRIVIEKVGISESEKSTFILKV